jgi:hypothetical protein
VLADPPVRAGVRRQAGLTERALVLQRVVYAGLDALRLVLAPDLCACVHAGMAESPQLYLRAPDLSSLSATEAFTLFSGLRDLLEAGDIAASGRTVAGYTAVVRATSGEASRAVWAVGRWDGSFDPYQEEVAVELIKGVGAVAHALDDAAAPEEAGSSIRISVDSQGDRVHAQVWVPVAGSVQTATSDGASPMTAVAQATLATVNPALKLGNVAEDIIDGERAVLVLVRDVNGRAGLGCALCGDDAVRAVAQAALRAARTI